MEAPEAAVGRNIRRLRAAAGLSLADLAAAAGGLSKTTLHGIEQGGGNPTLATLWALATALGVPLGELIAPPPEAPVTVVRAGEGPRADGAAVHARLLHRIAMRGMAEVYAIEVDAVRQDSLPHAAGVEECMIVTAGRIRTGPAAELAGLAAGDAIRFSAAVPHVYEGLDQRNTALLLMLHPAGTGRAAGDAARAERLRKGSGPRAVSGGPGAG